MRHTPTAIRAFLTDQQVSGLTIADFCAENHLKVPTFYSWKKKYGVTEPVEPEGFYTITPKLDTATRSLCLPSGLRVELTGLTTSEIAGLILEIDRAHA